MVTAVPPVSADDQGTDTIAARDDGELAVRLLGDRRILVLHHSDDYQSSEIVTPEAEGVPMACAWDGEVLLIAMHDGALYRVDLDGTATEITRVQGTPVGMATSADSVHVLCAPSPGPTTGNDYNRLWSIPSPAPTQRQTSFRTTGASDSTASLSPDPPSCSPTSTEDGSSACATTQSAKSPGPHQPQPTRHHRRRRHLPRRLRSRSHPPTPTMTTGSPTQVDRISPPTRTYAPSFGRPAKVNNRSTNLTKSRDHAGHPRPRPQNHLDRPHQRHLQLLIPPRRRRSRHQPPGRRDPAGWTGPERRNPAGDWLINTLTQPQVRWQGR